MSDSNSPRPPPNRRPPAEAVPRPVSTGTSGRFERPGAPRTGARATPSRHAAITRTLHNYASYKTWAEKMRSNFEPAKAPKG